MTGSDAPRASGSSEAKQLSRIAALLRQAEGTLNVEARRELMCRIETIMQERGPIGNSYWKNVWNITHERFVGIEANPTAADFFYEVYDSTL